jgi:hypothetical protein
LGEVSCLYEGLLQLERQGGEADPDPDRNQSGKHEHPLKPVAAPDHIRTLHHLCDSHVALRHVRAG